MKLPHTVRAQPAELELAVNEWGKVRGHPLLPAAAVAAVNSLLCYVTELEARLQKLEGSNQHGNSSASDPRKD